MLFCSNILLLYDNLFLKGKSMIELSSATSATLKRTSTWGKWICLSGALAIVGYGVFLACVPGEALSLMKQSVPGIVIWPSTAVLLFAGGVAALPAVLFVTCLLVAWQVFDAAGRGHLYSLQGQNVLLRLSRLAMATAVAGMVCRTATALLLSSANPPGQKMLIIGISSGEITAVLAATLLAIFASVVREATALAQENKLFI